MHIEEKQKAVNKVAALLKDSGIFVLSIDKNQERFIDTGTRKIRIFPDTPEEIKLILQIQDYRYSNITKLNLQQFL